VTNTLAYCGSEFITTVKNLYCIGPRNVSFVRAGLIKKSLLVNVERYHLCFHSFTWFTAVHLKLQV
jgi:hypothetical protein